MHESVEGGNEIAVRIHKGKNTFPLCSVATNVLIFNAAASQMTRDKREANVRT